MPTTETVWGPILSPRNGSRTPRTPSHADRLLARKVGEALRKAAFNDPARIKTPTAIPAGRLVTRDGVQRSAQKAMGQPITAKPFRVTKRRHTPEPPVKVGLMLDVSGSMGWACPVLTASAWAFAHAVKSIGGTFTAVGFGERIYPLVPPGSTPAQVTPISAVDGHEAFSAGFSTVNGALGLTVGDGVRLLVVVSDGHLVARGEPEKARKAVDAVIRAGGHVLWFDRSPRDPRVIPDGASYAQVTNPDDIPAAMVAALRDALHGR